MASSSAMRTGLLRGMTGVRTAISARFTTWVKAAAATIGLGVIRPGA
jgi:hypothetical protein